jgi:predicted MPP superfamily phosphohydrolase
MPLSFILRRCFLIVLLILPQRFWIGRGWKLSGRLKDRRLRFLIKSFLTVAVVMMALVLYDRISQKIFPDRLSGWVAPIVQLWIFTSTFTFLCEQLLRLIFWLGRRLHRLFKRAGGTPEDASRRSALRYAALLLRASPFMAAVYGYAVERLRFEVVRVDVPIANLSRELDGLRIVQLSDIHAGDLLPMPEIRRAVRIAQGLDAHLAVITGDFVSGYGDPLEACIAELSLLKAPLGTWGCNGNHEIYAGVEDAAERLFQQHGMRLLRHSSAQISWQGAAFNLIGVDYQHDVQLTGSKLPSLRGVDALVRRDMPNILLSHNPNTFHRAAEEGIELSLAGHTHGGQVTIEILHRSWNPAKFMTPFIAGLYELPMPAGSNDKTAGKARLYVNRGIGTLGVPARLGAPPEITLLTLRSDKSSSS